MVEPKKCGFYQLQDRFDMVLYGFIDGSMDVFQPDVDRQSQQPNVDSFTWFNHQTVGFHQLRCGLRMTPTGIETDKHVIILQAKNMSS